MPWIDRDDGSKFCDACEATFKLPASCACRPVTDVSAPVAVTIENPYKDRVIAIEEELERLGELEAALFAKDVDLRGESDDLRAELKAHYRGEKGSPLAENAPTIQSLIDQSLRCNKRGSMSIEQQRKLLKDRKEILYGLADLLTTEIGAEEVRRLREAN